MSEVTPDLIGRMVDLVKLMADDAAVFPSLSSMDHYAEARNIVERLPDMTDPDLIEARACAADLMTKRDDSLGGSWVDAMIAGEMDDGNMVSLTLAGIKRGRILAGVRTSECPGSVQWLDGRIDHCILSDGHEGPCSLFGRPTTPARNTSQIGEG